MAWNGSSDGGLPDALKVSHSNNSATTMNPISEPLDIEVKAGAMENVDNPIKEKRKMRDVLFLIIFYAFFVSLLILASIGFIEGDPKVLFFGLDYRGSVCGEGRVKNFKAQYWPNVGQIASLMAGPANFYDSKSLCVKQCPKVDETLTSNYTVLPWVCNYPDGYGNTTMFPDPATNPSPAGSPVLMTYEEWYQNKYDYYQYLSDEQKADSLQLKGPCYPVLMKTTNQYGVCQPYGGIIGHDDVSSLYNIWKGMGGIDVDDPDDIIENAVFNYIEDAAAVMGRYVSDLSTAWVVVLVAGVVVSVILSYFWLMMLRLFAGLMAWTAIIFANLASIALTVLFYMKAGIFTADELDAFMGTDFSDDIPDEFDASKSNKDTLLIFAILATIFTVLVLLATAFMIRKIKIALRVIEVGRKAVSQHMTVMFYPLTLPFVFGVLFIAFWVFGIVHIFSMGDVKQRACTIDSTEEQFMGLGSNPSCGYTEACQCGYEVTWDNAMKYNGIYFLFGLLWVLQFNNGFTTMVVSGVVAPFYWNRGEPGKNKGAVMKAFRTTFWYHQGTIALGSFIIALIQLIRLMMKIVEARLSAMKKRGSKLVDYCMCCVNCCLWCLQKCVNFITHNAFIMAAIEGKGFFSSATRAGNLILGNAFSSAAVQIIGDSILAICKLSVVLGAGVAAFAILENPSYFHGDQKVSSPLVPVIASMIISYMLANKFFAVIETSIDTMFLSFCLDCSMHGGKAEFAPPALRTLVNHD